MYEKKDFYDVACLYSPWLFAHIIYYDQFYTVLYIGIKFAERKGFSYKLQYFEKVN